MSLGNVFILPNVMWSAFHEGLHQLVGLGLDLGAGRGGSSLGGVGEDFGKQAPDKSANKSKESRGVKNMR